MNFVPGEVCSNDCPERKNVLRTGTKGYQGGTK